MNGVPAKQWAPEKTLEEGLVDVLPSGVLAVKIDWGRIIGRWVLPLNFGFPATPNARVFCSAAEARVPGSIAGGTFIGAANIFLEMVATPEAARVDVQVNVEWEDPLPVQVSYLVVPAP